MCLFIYRAQAPGMLRDREAEFSAQNVMCRHTQRRCSDLAAQCSPGCGCSCVLRYVLSARTSFFFSTPILLSWAVEESRDQPRVLEHVPSIENAWNFAARHGT